MVIVYIGDVDIGAVLVNGRKVVCCNRRGTFCLAVVAGFSYFAPHGFFFFIYFLLRVDRGGWQLFL